jgi:transcriptional repressor of cell division inhibition gene dicB
MKKKLAIDLLGGSVTAAARTLGISYAAVHKWPEDLPLRISDRVEGAYARRQRELAATAEAEAAMSASLARE